QLHSRRVNRASLSLQTGILGVKRPQTIANIDSSAALIALARFTFRRISLSPFYYGRTLYYSQEYVLSGIAANRVFIQEWQLARHLAGLAAPIFFDFSTGSCNVSYFQSRFYNQSGIPVVVVWCLSFPCELIGQAPDT
ncbi:MAG: hypothetical protein JHC52_11980, partial [Chthoniobacterales bacterium]|nr:hypothetical protein [Chthoniobacterales bacterium]